MLTRSWGKALLIAALLLVALVASAGWYLAQHSMDAASGFEVNDPQATQRVLIATQGSTFKDAVVTGLVDSLRPRGIHVKVVDIAALPDVAENDWNAIVILHTWEMGRAPAAVTAFARNIRERRKLLVLTTSGAGDMRLAGVDVISSASRMPDVPQRVQQLLESIDGVIRVPVEST